MQIKSIELNNFKFHQNLNFNIDKKNCLIYGENGSGKSSIYWALYSLFKCYFRNEEFAFHKFQNKYTEEPLNINVSIDDIKLSLPNKKYLLPNEIEITNYKTIYFVNQDLLDEIITGDENFYLTILKLLKKYFTILNDFDKEYQSINEILAEDSENFEKENLHKNDVDSRYKRYIEEIITPLANNILGDFLKEDFIINLKFQGAIFDEANFRFPNPTITLTIENQNNLKLYFNEAKLKLTAIAIFFALVQTQGDEEKNNSIKLLVLDDFLTSLDMANRHYIIEYVFTHFEDYQIILLTHNLQFYNLILDWLNTYKKEKDWDIKNIYLRYNGDREESIIYSQNSSSYIEQAKERLHGDNEDLQLCGNLIRKEFERIIHELEKYYKLGKKEETDTILSLIINDKPIYLKQNNLVTELSRDIGHCNNMSNNIDINKERVKDKLLDISKKIKQETSTSNTHLKVILENLIFYRKILFNKSSHDNPDAEIYRKEYKNSIMVIEELNRLLSELP